MRSEDQMAGMNCPVDNTPLSMSDRQGIEIDYCPTCRGVWLDRGELDKIIERSGPAAPQARPAAQVAPQQPQSPYPPQQPWSGGYGGQHAYGHKRKKSWLEDIFD